MDTKICSKCKRELPATSGYFWKDKTHKDGLRTICRECENKDRDVFLYKETKICCRCKQSLPATEEYFYRNKKNLDGFRYECKACDDQYKIDRKEIIQAQRKAFSIRHKERLSEKNKNKYKQPTEKLRVRVKQLEKEYSISVEEVQSLMDIQKGCCEICGDSLVHPDSKKSYMVDHNHTTGSIRGLLCIRCNTAIGNFREDKEILTSAIEYLEKHNG